MHVDTKSHTNVVNTKVHTKSLEDIHIDTHSNTYTQTHKFLQTNKLTNLNTNLHPQTLINIPTLTYSRKTLVHTLTHSLTPYIHTHTCTHPPRLTIISTL